MHTRQILKGTVLIRYVVVLGLGYVLGTKAGRRRYEQIVGTYRALTGSPATKSMIDAGKDFYLVDVREPNEYEIVSIPGATLIPKGEFVSGAALEKLPQDKRIVLHCKSGARSAEALAVVKNAGFTDAVHVGGGVLAWINQVDPSLPSY